MTPKTTLRLNELLEGLIGLRKAVIFMVMIYYRKIIVIKIKSAKGKDAWVKSRRN